MKPYYLLFLLLVSLAYAEDNCTNTTVSDYWLNISLVPGQNLLTNQANCHANTSCGNCGNSTQQCVVSRKLNAGENYSVNTNSCQLNFSCDYNEIECEQQNYTHTVDIIFSRYDNDTMKIEVNGKAKLLPMDLDDFYYTFTEGIECPESVRTDCMNNNMSYTYEQCSKYIPSLLGSNRLWDFYTTSFNVWSNTLGSISTYQGQCTQDMARCEIEKGNMVNQSDCVSIQTYSDLQDKYDSMKIVNTLMKVALWIITPLFIIMFVIVIVRIIKEGGD